MKAIFSTARTGWGVALLALSMTAQAQTTHNVTVGDSFFSPSNLTIQVGDTVRWTNAAGGMTHNVTANNGSFVSVTSSQFTFDVTFNNAGQFGYHCTIHGAPGFGMSGTITVEGGGGGNPADLVMSEVSVNSDPTYAPGDALAIEAEVDNAGGGASPAYTVDFYASTNSTINSGDIFLGSANRPALGAGNDDNFNANFNLPQNIQAGNYFIGAIIDINDANNGNNSNADDEPITVQGAPAAADLVLQSVNAPNGSHEQGSMITIQSNTVNAGDLASGAYTLNFYASDNNIISDTDTPIGMVNRPSLAGGANNNNPLNAMIPANLAPGAYFIGGILDVVDANANNNVNLDGTPIQVTASSGPGFVINNGLNDAWFNAATVGQGFFITVFPELGVIFLAWFTYDTERPLDSIMAFLGEAGHRWLTAFGNYEGNIANLNIELTQGGVFNSADPATTQDPNYGTIEIEFIDCSNAIVRYNIPSLGLMGEIPITRIANDNVPRCLAEQPQ